MDEINDGCYCKAPDFEMCVLIYNHITKPSSIISNVVLNDTLIFTF